MKILLTGACGFIGRYVYRQLCAKGHAVFAIDSLVEQVHGPTGPTLDFLGIDVRGLWRTTVGNAASIHDPNTWAVDCIIHLAAEVGVGQSQYEPVRYVRANVMEVAQMWEAIARVKKETGLPKRVVVASSMSIYGEGEYLTAGHRLKAGLMREVEHGWDAFSVDGARGRDLVPVPTRESKQPEPASVYALSKYDTEVYSLILGKANEIPTTALRFFNVFGPGQSLSNPYTGVLAQFATRAFNDKAARVFEDGAQRRDFVFVEDIARAVVAAAEIDEPFHGPVNVGTGRPVTILHLAEQWAETHREVFGVKVPAPEITGQYRSGDIRHCIADRVRAAKVLGWEPTVSLAEGLHALAVALKSEGYPEKAAPDRQDMALSEMRDRGLVREVA